MTKSELQAAYDDATEALDEIAAIVTSDDLSAREKLDQISKWVLFEPLEVGEEDDS